MKFISIFNNANRMIAGVALGVALVVVTACNTTETPSPTEPQIVSTPLAAQPANTPSAENEPISPVKASESVTQSPLATPTPHPTPIIAKEEATARVPIAITVDDVDKLQPQPNAALITGRLIDETSGTPAPFVYVYLSKVIGPDAKPFVALDRGEALLSISNENGIFYFDTAPPGKYSIVVWSPVGSYLLKEPGTEFSLLFEVSAGETKHLGDLVSIIP